MSSGLQERVTRNVRILMALRGISDQKTLAARLGWGADKVSTSFSGRRRWSLDDLQELADVFGLQPGDVVAEPTQLVNITSPTGTEGATVTRAVTPEYARSNASQVIELAQFRARLSGYRRPRNGPAGRATRARASRGNPVAVAAG